MGLRGRWDGNGAGEMERWRKVAERQERGEQRRRVYIQSTNQIKQAWGTS